MATTLDTTFRNYTSTQALAYSTHRADPYSQRIYDLILQYHNSKGGAYESLLDVGCGTGQVTRNLALYFSHAKGVDPSIEMISQAEKNGGHTKSGESIAYQTQAAEELSELGEASVDVLVSGMAAHWFQMQEFWTGASSIVKSGGTVALWTNSSFYCLPSTPNASEVQRALSDLEDGFLGPFESESIKISRNMYDDLLMPWDCHPKVINFSKDKYVRHEWNRNGQLEHGQDDFFGGSHEFTLKELGETLGCASMVTKWRAANPNLVGTDQDCVKITIRRIAKALGAVDSDGDELTIRAGCATALVLFTRS